MKQLYTLTLLVAATCTAMAQAPQKQLPAKEREITSDFEQRVYLLKVDDNQNPYQSFAQGYYSVEKMSKIIQPQWYTGYLVSKDGKLSFYYSDKKTKINAQVLMYQPIEVIPTPAPVVKPDEKKKP